MDINFPANMKSQNIYSPIFENKDELITKVISKSFELSKTDNYNFQENQYPNLIKRTIVIIEKELMKIFNHKYGSSNNLNRSVHTILNNAEDSILNLDQHIEIFIACRRVLIERILSIGYEKVIENNIINSARNLIDLTILAFYKKCKKEITESTLRDKNIINNLKIVKDDLQKQLNSTYQLIKNSPVGLVGCDSDLIIKLWNPVAENLTGYQISNVIGKSILTIFSTSSQSVLKNQLSSALPRRKRLKLNIQTRDGGLLNVYVLISRLKSELKQKIQYIINIVDLRKEEQLKIQSEKMEQLGAIARLSDAIMHDVRNPINSLALNIDVLTEFLKEGSLLSKQINEIVEKINRQISYLSLNLNQYIGYSRINELKLEPIDLREPLNELILETHQKLFGKEITLKYHRSKIPLTINGDWNQLIRVFRNLIDNAIDAIEEKGNIDVYMTKKNKNVSFSIVDNGHGIKPENLDNVFKSYFTTKEKGSGLGLFIVREIVRAHHGKVYCTSTDGKGSRFTVSIPAIMT